MRIGAEYYEVEKPLLDQLEGLGWSHIEGSKIEPATTERESFRDTVLESRLREAMRRINPGPDGQPWLDDDRLSEAISALTRPGQGKLLETNQRSTRLLLNGFSVSGLAEWDQGRSQLIRFIDFDQPGRNDFLAINQFRVDEPGGQAKRFVLPDVVLFVNGIPLVVIECKAPDTQEPMAEAIDQLRRYANQRGLEVSEGNERLFWTNQFLVGTHGDRARVGTFTAGPEHYAEWKHPAPLTCDELASQLAKPTAELTGQELLTAGMLTPENLLDLIRHFTLVTEIKGRRTKIIARYQQYRAVLRALDRLRGGATRAQDGEQDRRGGLIWHTQGSGKSLTMVFLVRAMRSDPALRSFKVVVVTDRTDLEEQLSSTAELSGDPVRRAGTTTKLRGLLEAKGPGLVFALIQKYQDADSDNTSQTDTGGLSGEDESSARFGELNSDESILVLADEAHRSHTSTLHAHLREALPNAATIGFTGTPIMRADKKHTSKIFGNFIDTYTIRQAEADDTVVPIHYESRTTKGAVTSGSDLDELFEDMFVERSDEELEKLKARYATSSNVLEAPKLIQAKARSMLWHYVSTVLPNGFKAQIAATSRLACVRYREALFTARDELLAQIDALSDELTTAADAGRVTTEELDRRTAGLLHARTHRNLLAQLDFVPVFSGANNDPADWTTWTNKAQQKRVIADFKKDIGVPGDDTSPVAFLIVRTMLLTGFDAPVEQVLYLDQSIRDADLLQAIARVNRTADGKHHGMLVDYYGVGANLQQALKAYAPEDTEDSLDAMTSIADELPKLRDRHVRVVRIFIQAGIETFSRDEDVEACVQVLADDALRARFGIRLKEFLSTLDTVLPRPEALPYVPDAKQLGVIQKLARRRYRTDGIGEFDPSLYGQKVRELIDEHVTALDIATKIPPVSITDPHFLAKVKGLTSEQAQASEMEHALRYHITKHFDEDPARYTKLSERLDEILNNLRDQAEQRALALEELTRELNEQQEAEQEQSDPLVSRMCGLLEQELTTSGTAAAGATIDVSHLAERIVVEIVAEANKVKFWHNPHAQDGLRNTLVDTLDRYDLIPFAEQGAVADRMMELARHNQQLIAQYGSDSG